MKRRSAYDYRNKSINTYVYRKVSQVLRRTLEMPCEQMQQAAGRCVRVSRAPAHSELKRVKCSVQVQQRTYTYRQQLPLRAAAARAPSSHSLTHLRPTKDSLAAAAGGNTLYTPSTIPACRRLYLLFIKKKLSNGCELNGRSLVALNKT